MFDFDSQHTEMIKLGVEDLKRIQICILDEVVSFCDANNINYWLDCGTLLGAIRHNGYIPWDDDIDVGMLRKDFDYFMKSFNSSNDRYKAYCVDTKPDFFFVHGKVLDTYTTLYEPDEKSLKLCVNIDIFAYDNAPDDEKLLKKTFARRDFLRNCNVLRNLRNTPNGNFIRKTFIGFMRLCLKPFPSNFFARKMSNNAKKYNNTQTERVGNFTSFTRTVCSRQVFNTYSTHVFEGKNYKIPGGYDEWLRSFYGDYMKLPPNDKRVSYHTFVAYMNK